MLLLLLLGVLAILTNLRLLRMLRSLSLLSVPSPALGWLGGLLVLVLGSELLLLRLSGGQSVVSVMRIEKLKLDASDTLTCQSSQS